MATFNFGLQVSCKKSKDKGILYHVLEADFGYRVATLTMEKDVISEVLGLPISALYSMKEGDVIKVGTRNA